MDGQRVGIVLIILILCALFALVGIAYINREPTVTEPELQPDLSPVKEYEFEGYILELYHREWFKTRQYGALLDTGDDIQFHGEVYIKLEVDDKVKIFNWDHNWFYTHRWMEVYRDDELIGEYTMWW